jgi:hypothetical protein
MNCLLKFIVAIAIFIPLRSYAWEADLRCLAKNSQHVLVAKLAESEPRYFLSDGVGPVYLVKLEILRQVKEGLNKAV